MQFLPLFDRQKRYKALESHESLLIEDLKRPSSPSKGSTSTSTYKKVFLVLFSFSVGICLGFWLQVSNQSKNGHFGVRQHSPIPQDVFTKRHSVPFVPDERYIGPSSEVAHNWRKLTEASDSIFITDPEAYSLSDPGIRAPFFIFNDPPKAAEEADTLTNFYVLSNLHQLHCVNMIRMRYNKLVYDAEEVTPLSDSPLNADWITHIEHCFEYLRLSITCGDYMVLESDSPPGSPEEYWKDGLSWGVVHSCIDWNRLIEFQTQQVVAYNKTWSEGN